MGGADLFRGGYAQQSAQATQMYTQHPITRQVLAEMKSQFDARCLNADAARSLEAFYRQHDTGCGEVRLEDFKAGWSLGGVLVHPHQMASMRGAYGSENGNIRYPEVIAAMDNLGYEQGLSIVMTTKMGPTTARHMGYTQGNPVIRGYLDHHSRTHSAKGTSAGKLASNTTISADSLLRSSNIKPVSQPLTESPKGTFNCTAVTNNSVTQRHKSMVAPSLSLTLEKITSASVAAPDLASTLKDLDTANTGCVTLDAFLTACARAGLTLRPDELDTLRLSGQLRRPYDKAPELIEYSTLDIFGL